MNYTEKYHLPQWKKEDRIMMDDFNQMCANLEEGIAQAQGMADTAQQTAAAAYSPNQKPYVVGSYTGNGSAKTIKLGFRPSFLIISGAKCHVYAEMSSGMSGYLLATAGNAQQQAVTFTNTGFKIEILSSSYPVLTAANKTYDYIAFR